MTNAEKYLKEGVDSGQFVKELVRKISHFDDCKYYSTDMEHEIVLFLQQPVKLTLTEDARTILSKLKSDYKYIGRKKFFGSEFLYVSCEEKCDKFTTLTPFEHLFDFIKCGEEYSIEELLDEKV